MPTTHDRTCKHEREMDIFTYARESKKKYDDDRFLHTCHTCGQPFYKEAFEVAKAYIDSFTGYFPGDAELPNRVVHEYEAYRDALERLEVEQTGEITVDKCFRQWEELQAKQKEAG